MIDLNKIYNEDCLKGLDNFSESSIDLIVTSPPYYNAKAYSYWENYNLYLEWLENVFQKCFTVLKEGRMCVVNISVIIEPRQSRSHESKRIALPFHFVNIMEKIGFKFLEDIIWVKPEGSAKNRNGRFFQDRQPVQYKPNIINEYIFVFQKPMKGLIDKIVRSYTGEIKDKSLVEDGYERSNVWYFNPETRSKHLAPYPIELPDKIIQYYSYINDLVLDPFIGSGTTAVSCIKNQRNFIGFELSKDYHTLATNRIDEIK